MAHFESFETMTADTITGTDFLYVRRAGNPSGSRDAKIGFGSYIKGLWAAATGADAREAIGFLTATASLDFPSIAAGAKADLTIAVPGAKVGDALFLGLPAAPAAGLVFNAFVSATNTVTIRAQNASSGSVDESSMTFRVVVVTS